MTNDTIERMRSLESLTQRDGTGLGIRAHQLRSPVGLGIDHFPSMTKIWSQNDTAYQISVDLCVNL